MKRTLGIHALVWSGDMGLTELGRAVRRSREIGYGLFEFSLHDVPSMDVPAIAAVIEENNMDVVASRGLKPNAEVSSEDPAVVRRGVELLYESLDTTRGLGGKLLTGALYGAFGKATSPISNAGFNNAVSALSDAADYAREKGMCIGLEICNRYETNVVNTAADGMRLLERIGRDNTVIHLDTYHMNIEEKSHSEAIRTAGDRLGYVHVGESNRGILGEGFVDFDSVFRELDYIGYVGPLTFEAFSTAVRSPGLSDDLAVWRETWKDSGAVASAAYEFLSSRPSVCDGSNAEL